MKACLLLQRRFAYVGHKLAIILKEKYGINEFCGYVYLRSSYNFLKNQKEVNYSSLLLDEDIHNRYKEEVLDLSYLKQIEKEYGLPSLWPYIAMDRIIMFNMLVREYPYNTPRYSHEDMMRIFQVKIKVILEFFEREKPDFLIMSVIGTIGTMLLYQIAKKMGVKVFFIMETRIANGSVLTDNYKNLNWVNEVFDKYQRGDQQNTRINEARTYIDNFRTDPNQHLNFWAKEDIIANKNRFKEFRWFLPKNLFRSFNWFLHTCYRFAADKKYRDYGEENPLTYLLDRLKRKTRTLIGFSHLYDEADYQEDYAFFPLHFEPEIATLLFAPQWTDQLNLIKQIAQSLPLHFKLYVKEHPGMVGYRTHAYYKELKKIPNVKLIAPGTLSFAIIKYAKLVVTIVGTAGWESILLKKPVITFGDVFYNTLSSTKKCTTIETLPFLVKEQLENFHHNEKELENFVGALLKESAPVGLMEIWGKGLNDKQEEKKRLELLADLIANKIGLTS